VVGIIENPATSTNDAAALLGAVTKARSETNLYLRARVPELLILVTTSALASVIARDHKTANGLTAAIALVATTVNCVLYFRRRRNLGGTVEWALWIVAALLFVASVGSNLLVHGKAEELSLGLLLASAFLVLGSLERSWVLVITGLVLVPLSLVPTGGLDRAVSFAFGLGAAVLVVAVGMRKPLFERKSR
jgi:hypothetical protein